MAADPRGYDPDHIHLDDLDQVAMWTRSLGICREDLERAVAAVGDATGAVYDYLSRRRSTA